MKTASARRAFTLVKHTNCSWPALAGGEFGAHVLLGSTDVEVEIVEVGVVVELGGTVGVTVVPEPAVEDVEGRHWE